MDPKQAAPCAVVATALALATWTAWPHLRLRLSRTPLDNIPGPTGHGSFAFGHINELWNSEGWEFHDLIAKYGPVSKIKTYFGATGLYVFDPKVTHAIMVKNQRSWEEPLFFHDANKVLLGEGIFTSTGERHRIQRKLLMPLFSVAHLRNMVTMFHEVVRRGEDTLSGKVAQGPQEIDVLSWTTRIALELVTTSGFGLSVDKLDNESQPHPYSEASRRITPSTINIAGIQGIVTPLLVRLGPRWFRRLLVNIIALGVAPIKDMRYVVDTMYATALDIFQSKKAALESGDLLLAEDDQKSHDIIGALLKSNLAEAEEERLSDAELLGQINSLAFAATDTTSTALSRTLHLLAMHKDVQDKLRNEIRGAKEANGGEDLDHETLVSLKYLDAICRETLRLYPSLNMVQRVATEDTTVPLSAPVKGVNGDLITSLPILKGTAVYIGIRASNTNPALWGPDAQEWKPERWLNPLPQALEEASIAGVYSHLLTFLGGARSCIGFKFSQLEMKVVLFHLLDRLEFSLAKDRPISWKMTAITTPWDWEHNKKAPSLPMVVALAP